MTLQKNFSNSLRAVYKSRNQSLAAFADELGISRSALQEILNGNSNPRIDTIELIAKGLDANPLALLSDSFTEEEISLLMPLFKLSDVASALSDDEKKDLVSHVHAIMRILIGPDKK